MRALQLWPCRVGTPVDVAVGPVDTVTGTSGMQIGSGASVWYPGMFRLQQRFHKTWAIRLSAVLILNGW